MFCLCKTQLDVLLQASTSLSTSLSAGLSLPPLPSAVLSFVNAPTIDPSLSLDLALQLPSLSAMASLTAMANLVLNAQMLGLDLFTSVGLEAMASLCAQLDLSMMAPLASFPLSLSVQLSAYLSAAIQIGIALGVNLFAEGDISLALEAAVNARLALIVPAPSFNISVMAQLQAMATIQAAFGPMLNLDAIASLEASLDAIASVSLPSLSIPMPLLNIAACLQVMFQANINIALGDLLAMLSLRLSLIAGMVADFSFSVGLPALSMSIDASLIADLSASLSLDLPALSVGLPALSLIASLNASMPVLATPGCPICTLGNLLSF